jgi:hypothetical protein
LNAADQPAVSVSIFESKYARTVEALLDYADTDRFIDDLRTAWERPIQSKEANVLLSPAVFDAGRSTRPPAASRTSSRCGASGWTTTAATCRTRSSPPFSRGSEWSR